MISPSSFFIWLFTTLAFYLTSYILTKTTYFRFPDHRKIWNMILLLAFSITGLIGMTLALFDAYDTALLLSSILARFHVRFGIVMFVIAVFHFAWHWNYFKKAFKQLMNGELGKPKK